MIFLSETKMKDHRVTGVRRLIRYSNGYNVEPVGMAGGLSLWWEDSVEIETIDSSRCFIDAHGMVGDFQSVFRFTGVYGTSY